MILVTGATGFIGSHLVEALLARGERVRSFVRRPGTTLPGGEVIRGDLVTGAGLQEALKDVRAVFHLAGATKVLRSADYYSANVTATENLVRLLHGRGIRLVHVSSLAAAGPSPGPTPLDEDAEPHPLTAYGKSKLEGERVVRALAEDAVIVRPPVVYGPRDTDVFQILKPISRGWAFEISGGERWFSAIYVRDLVDGLIAAWKAPSASGRTYFLCHPAPLRWQDFTLTAARIMGRRLHPVRIPAAVAYTVACLSELRAHAAGKPGIVSRDKVAEARCSGWVCDGGRAASELGFRARTPLEKGLAETLAWYKEAGWLRF